jgi:hypothetical protein
VCLLHNRQQQHTVEEEEEEEVVKEPSIDCWWLAVDKLKISIEKIYIVLG